MSKYHERQLRSINRAHERVSKAQGALNDQFSGVFVQLKIPVREWHGGSRHPAGRRFVVDRVFVGDREEPYLFLRRADRNHPTLGVSLKNVEFIAPVLVVRKKQKG